MHDGGSATTSATTSQTEYTRRHLQALQNPFCALRGTLRQWGAPWTCGADGATATSRYISSISNGRLQ